MKTITLITILLLASTSHAGINFAMNSRYEQQLIKERYRINREFNTALKQIIGPCIACGYEANLAAINFHHVDPKSKNKAISKYNWRNDWNNQKAELIKTIPLCGNCHTTWHNPRYDNSDTAKELRAKIKAFISANPNYMLEKLSQFSLMLNMAMATKLDQVYNNVGSCVYSGSVPVRGE